VRPRDASWTTWRARRAELARTAVVVLYGGESSEREVSCRSGRALARALAEADPRDGAPVPERVIEVEIDAEGRWNVDGLPRSAPEALLALPGEALFVLGLHGGAGEDGRLQGFLEVARRRYTGSGPAASALCMDKRRTREAAAAAGVRVAPGRLVGRDAPIPRATPALVDLGGPPWFVKPNRGGSSVGVSRVPAAGELGAAIEAVHAGGDDALVEVGQDGLEVTCGVIGEAPGELVLLPVVEIVPKEGRFFDYQEKYSADGAGEHCPPRALCAASAERVQERAAAVYRAAGCAGYARIDFIVPPEGVGGEAEPVLLEVNTLPGFTARSILPQAAAATGVSFRELCLELCARALERFERPGAWS